MIISFTLETLKCDSRVTLQEGIKCKSLLNGKGLKHMARDI